MENMATTWKIHIIREYNKMCIYFENFSKYQIITLWVVPWYEGYIKHWTDLIFSIPCKHTPGKIPKIGRSYYIRLYQNQTSEKLDQILQCNSLDSEQVWSKEQKKSSELNFSVSFEYESAYFPPFLSGSKILSKSSIFDSCRVLV